MNAEQPNSTAPSLLRNRSSWGKGGKPSLRGCVTKRHWSVRCGNGRGLWSLHKAVMLTRKDAGAISCCPWSQDQAAASGPVSSTKANTRFPLRTWLCTSYLITKWMYLLQREKASRRLCSQLFCSFSGPFSIFSCCVSSIVVCILKCTCCTALTHRPLYTSVYWESCIHWESPLHSFCHLSTLIHQYHWIPNALLYAV